MSDDEHGDPDDADEGADHDGDGPRTGDDGDGPRTGDDGDGPRTGDDGDGRTASDGGRDGVVGSLSSRLGVFETKTVATVADNPLASWLLFRGERWRVVVALLAGVFGVLLALAFLRPVDMVRLLSDTRTLETLFVALLSGAILIVSVVSSISSIVLSQEITDIETERNRIDAAIEFRRRTEQKADVEGSPASPAAFLETILYSIYRETNRLRAAVADSDDSEFRDRVDAFTEDVLAEARTAAETLDGARFGTFQVLSAGLYYDYAWQLNTAHRIRNVYADSLTDEEDAALEDLMDTLRFFATGREYFQSLYYKREVARLSTMLLYVSLPVIVFISYFVLAFDSTTVPNVPVGPLSTLSIFVLFAYTVSLAPYLVLTAYVLRVGAITTRTLAAGPFTIQQSSHEAVVDLDVETDPAQWDDTVDLTDDGADESNADGAADERDADNAADESDDTDPSPADHRGGPARGDTQRDVDWTGPDRRGDAERPGDGTRPTDGERSADAGRSDGDADRS